MLCASPASPDPRPRWHKKFTAMLPQITKYAKIAFAYLKPEARAEAVQEVVANACQRYARLVEQGKTAVTNATALARYGIKQTRDHRKVGGTLNVLDILSKYCQSRKGLAVERLDKFNRANDAWEEVLVEDRTAGPADIVQTKLDFSDFLTSLKRRDRRVAKFLATGETTKVRGPQVQGLRRQDLAAPPRACRQLASISSATIPALPLPTRLDSNLWLASCHAPQPSPGSRPHSIWLLGLGFFDSEPCLRPSDEYNRILTTERNTT